MRNTGETERVMLSKVAYESCAVCDVHSRRMSPYYLTLCYEPAPFDLIHLYYIPDCLCRFQFEGLA